MVKPPLSADDAVALVRKSQLVPEPVLAAFLAARPEPFGCPKELMAALVKAKLLTPFQAKLVLQGKYKGFFLGSYKMLDQIGSGGMGQVFLAEHTSLRRKDAIKVLPGRLAEDPTSVERFFREARAAAALDHPNIVRAHDVRCERGTYFLVMEYVPGRNLAEIMAAYGGRLGWGEAVGYMVQVAAALQHAHDRGIVHRDVKPANILVDREGTVKVLDMGLARFYADTGDNLTQKIGGKAMLGTADYVAPEQLKDSSAVDRRADLYSLGATLFHLVTGRPPFEGTITAKLMAHASKTPPAAHEVCPDLPVELSAVVARLMAKRPEERYDTAADLIAALAPFMDGPSSAPLSSKILPALAAAAAQSTSDLRPALNALATPTSSLSLQRTPRSGIMLDPSSSVIPMPSPRQEPAAAGASSKRAGLVWAAVGALAVGAAAGGAAVALLAK